MFRGLSLAVFLALALTLTAHAPVQAADPTPAPSPVLLDPLDPRAGEGASRVGAPFLALVVVIGLGAAAVVATFAFVRVTRRA